MLKIYTPNILKYTKSAIEAINDGWISNHGKYVDLATEKIKEITKSKFAILMANGTCATHCLFLAIKYKHPDIKKIYVPNNCYVAAWNAVLMVYRIDQIEVLNMNSDTWNMETSEEYLNTLDKNSAVLIVHNLGNVINVPRIKKIRPDLILVEDNCEGMFGKYCSEYSGMSDTILCSSCSFYGNKILTTGEGGCFFTQNKEVYDYIKLVYSQGMSEHKYLHCIHAYNYRMTNIEAAFLYDQLNDIDTIMADKTSIFNKFDILFNDLVELKYIKLMKQEDNTCRAPWIYALRILDNHKTIKETIEFFAVNNIDIRPFFYPINSHDHLSTIVKKDDIAVRLNSEVIMIPSSSNMVIDDQEKVLDVVYKFIFDKIGLELITINGTDNVDVYSSFISKIEDNELDYSTYKNTILCTNNDTIILQDKNDYKYIGYSIFNTSTGEKYTKIKNCNNKYQAEKLDLLLYSYYARIKKYIKQ